MIALIDFGCEIDDAKIYELIDRVVTEYKIDNILTIDQTKKISEGIFSSIRGMDVLEDLLFDNEVTEIMINGYDNIFIEKNGKIYKYQQKFESKEKLDNIIQQMVSKVNRRVNEASPIADSRLEDGSRVNIVLNPISIDGPAVTIRKFPKNRITMERLIEKNSISEDAAEFLRILVIAGYNIFISGGTGSGKTTFLNALSNFIPKDERIITIEDSAELQIQNIDNLVRLESRQPNLEGENGISIRNLIKSSLRMRPDRIIVGEVRGDEAIDMLQAMNTGHDGSLSTGHANSPVDMLSRLETMVLMGTDMPLAAIKQQIASGIDILVHLGRLRDKSRKVLEIVEIDGYREGRIETHSIFKFIENNTDKVINGHVEGKMEWTGKGIKNIDKLIRAGFYLEAKKFGSGN